MLVYLQDKLGINDYKESAWMPGAPGIRCSYIYFYQNAVQLKQEANESHEDKFIIHFLYSSVVTKDSTALQDFSAASIHCIIHL